MRTLRSISLLAVLFSATQANADPIYTIKDLGPNPGGGAFRISDTGVIGGTFGSTAVAILHGSITPLWAGIANDTNASGDIVGLSNGEAVVWSGGAVRSLGGGAGNGISNSGLVVGSMLGMAALWDLDGSLIPLEDLGSHDSAAFGVNDAAHVVGTSRSPGANYHAVHWIDGAVFELPSLCTTVHCQSFANAINAHDQIAGQTGGHAVIWDSAGLHDLGTLAPNSSSYGIDINDFGWVVGDAPVPNLPTAAFVFDGHAMYDLNDLIVGKNPFSQLSVAQGINNSGDIVGIGFVGDEIHAFLATHRGRPLDVPEPGTVVMILCGLVGLAARRASAQTSQR